MKSNEYISPEDKEELIKAKLARMGLGPEYIKWVYKENLDDPFRDLHKHLEDEE